MKLTGDNQRTRGKTCRSATLSTTNPTWTDPGSNPGLCDGRPAANRLSHGAAQHMLVKHKNEHYNMASRHRGGIDADFYNSAFCLTLALGGFGWPTARAGRCTRGDGTQDLLFGKLDGQKGGLEGCGKSPPPHRGSTPICPAHSESLFRPPSRIRYTYVCCYIINIIMMYLRSYIFTI
jgi:hypothetical protein